jgi:hypothetical protein
MEFHTPPAAMIAGITTRTRINLAKLITRGPAIGNQRAKVAQMWLRMRMKSAFHHSSSAASPCFVRLARA